MDPLYAPWIALACGILGMMIGYFMGYRTGRIAGELAALKAVRSRRDRSRESNRRSAGHGREDRPEEIEDLELASRTSSS